MSFDLLTTATDCEIISTRIVNANIECVFEAWSNPVHLKKWWGPAGFTNTFLEFDFQIGGKWQFIMHAPDKGNFANECVFIKIEKPSFIAWQRISKPLFQVHAKFEEITSDKTKIIFKMAFETSKDCIKLKPYVLDKNEENFDRLEKVLDEMNA
ncbi:MAG: SRPBCC domain-containing protein [Bacteroidetes bacterium]|jgi:uncharacterized protein YndB with AHSA1/START domain|nr:SRPBCC domain-containing protein [Bacteroidota bacterium]